MPTRPVKSLYRSTLFPLLRTKPVLNLGRNYLGRSCSLAEPDSYPALVPQDIARRTVVVPFGGNAFPAMFTALRGPAQGLPAELQIGDLSREVVNFWDQFIKRPQELRDAILEDCANIRPGKEGTAYHFRHLKLLRAESPKTLGAAVGTFMFTWTLEWKAFSLSPRDGRHNTIMQKRGLWRSNDWPPTLTKWKDTTVPWWIDRMSKVKFLPPAYRNAFEWTPQEHHYYLIDPPDTRTGYWDTEKHKAYLRWCWHAAKEGAKIGILVSQDCPELEDWLTVFGKRTRVWAPTGKGIHQPRFIRNYEV